eukprot:2869340-Lingulodinium_polyedra.AAC.1
MGGIVQYGLDAANASVARRIRDAAPVARLFQGIASGTPNRLMSRPSLQHPRSWNTVRRHRPPR